MGLRFLHCSDIHLLNLRGVGPRRFLNKRFTGGVNLLLKRRKQHDEALFDRLVEHARALDVERVVITGDLSNLALEREFEHIDDKLQGIGLPVTVIPGNHDAYTRGSVRSLRFEAMLGHHMQGDRLTHGDGGSEFPYPFVQRHDDVALIGLSTAQASLPLHAIGTVGAAQLARLRTMLEALAEEGLTRVVLIHHPVIVGESKPRHDLIDLDAFGRVIAAAGAELILHGHEHRRIEGSLDGPEGPVPVHGISSATNLSQVPGREAAFSVYEVGDGRLDRALYCWDGSDFRPCDEAAA